jgi:hypothetical protein
MSWRAALYLGLLFAPSLSARATSDFVCAPWKSKPRSERIGNTVLKISQTHDPAIAEVQWCRAAVMDNRGKEVFSITDYGTESYRTDLDINNDGDRDLVVETYSGGAHCCWTYSVIATNKNPHLVLQIENESAVAFADRDSDGKVELWASDGKFDYFDGMSHADTYFPTIVLQINGRTVSDISPRFREYYDGEIAKAKDALTPDKLQPFSGARSKDEFPEYYERVAPRVLQVVLSYLYCGRQNDAYKALQQMWPIFDQQRVWQLILQTRAQGLRRYSQAWKTAH